MPFDEKPYGKADNVQEQVNQTSDIDYDTLKKRLASIEVELTQMKQQLEVLDIQIDAPREPSADNTQPILTITPGETLKGIGQITMSVNEPASTLDRSTTITTSGVSVTDKTQEKSKELSEVSDLSEIHTEDAITLTWTNPIDGGFSHVRIVRDGTEIANHITNEMYQDTTISADTTYEYKVISVYLVNSVGIVKSITTDKKPTEPQCTTYLSFNGVNDFAEAINPISLADKTGHVIKATIRIPEKRPGNRGFFGFNNKVANQYNEVFLLSESKQGRMAYWNRGFVYGKPLPIGEWIDIEWRHENNTVTFIVNGEITGQGSARSVRTDNTNFWLGKTNIDGEFGEFDIKMLEVEEMLLYDFTKLPEDPTIIKDISGHHNNAKLTGGEWVEIEDSENPTDDLNIDGGSFTDTSFKRSFDGGLFTEPQNGKRIDGGDFNGG